MTRADAEKLKRSVALGWLQPESKAILMEMVDRYYADTVRVAGVPEAEPEQVNHPAHYNIPGRKECIEEMLDKFGESMVWVWCNITAYKYDYRAGQKGSAETDKAKAAWYRRYADKLRESVLRSTPIDIVQDVSDMLRKEV